MSLFITKIFSSFRQVAITFCLGTLLFFSLSLIPFSPEAQALPRTQTPEASSRIPTPQDHSQITDTRTSANSDNGEGGIVDNIREKLNLDQPIAPSTKKFIESVKGKTDEVKTPAREALENQTGASGNHR